MTSLELYWSHSCKVKCHRSSWDLSWKKTRNACQWNTDSFKYYIYLYMYIYIKQMWLFSQFESIISELETAGGVIASMELIDFKLKRKCSQTLLFSPFSTRGKYLAWWKIRAAVSKGGRGWYQVVCMWLLLDLLMNFFSFTRRFWNQMVTCRSERLVAAEMRLLLSLVMNLLAAYSFSSSFSWILV